VSKQPFLPLFFGDLLASTATWEGEERALYILLLAYQWTGGALPSDQRKLARMAQFDQKNFSVLWETVGKKFIESDAGLINVRLEQHRERANEISNKRANAGAIGGAKTAAKTKQLPQSNIANAEDLLGHPIQTIPNHSNPIQTTQIQGAHEAPRETEEEIFENVSMIKGRYPKAAREDWITAEKRMRQLVLDADTTWDALLAGVERYAKHCKATNRMVLNPANFFGAVDRPWQQEWPLPTTRSETAQNANISAAQQWLENSNAPV
jgi:uncharacterized protein YdaU (DUF1376 family)